MSDGFEARLTGVDDLRRALADAARKIRTGAVRGALRSAGNVIKRQAQAMAPVLKQPRPGRAAGTVRRAIAVRASKFARRAGDEGVFIGVRPLRGARQKKLGKAGTNNPNDPYYWRFVEFGSKPHLIRAGRGKRGLAFGGRVVPLVRHPGTRARPFLRPAADQAGHEAVQVFMRSVVPQIEKLNDRAARGGR